MDAYLNECVSAGELVEITGECPCKACVEDRKMAAFEHDMACADQEAVEHHQEAVDRHAARLESIASKGMPECKVDAKLTTKVTTDKQDATTKSHNSL